MDSRPTVLLRSPEGIEVGSDVPHVALGHTQHRHGRSRLNRLGIADPAHQVVRSVEEPASESGPASDAVEGRADLAARSRHARNAVAGLAAVARDDLLPARRIAAGHRGGLLLDGLPTTAEKDEREQQADSAGHRSQPRSGYESVVQTFW